MKTRTRFIILTVLFALVIFPLWRYLIQQRYLWLLGWIVAALGSILPYGKAALSNRITPGVGEIAFDLFDFRRTVVIDLSSIVTSIVPLLALVSATPVRIKNRLVGAGLGVVVAVISHIVATTIILWWQAQADTGTIEGLKIFIDGVWIAALPLLYWAVWVGYVKKGGLNEILKK